MLTFPKSILLCSFAALCATFVAGNNNISRENLNALIIRNMQHQMKTMEASLKLVQASCGKLPYRRGTVVAFHAKLKSTLTDFKADDVIVFGDVRLNEGNGYNNQSGVFKALSDGIYVFEWTILTYPGKYFHLDFKVNDKSAAITHNSLSSGSHPGVSSSVVVKLQKGDKTWLESYSSIVGQYAYRTWTYISGFKL